MLKEKVILVLLVVFTSVIGLAQDKGLPIFQDDFKSKETFAKNWLTRNLSFKLDAGNITLPQGGIFTMRHALPLEFCAEATLVMNNKGGKNNAAIEAGFHIMGYHFYMRGDGLARLLFKLPGAKRSQGISARCTDFELGKPFKITVIRKIKDDNANYTLQINGKNISNFDTAIPAKKANGSYGELSIFSRSAEIAVSDFCLSSIEKSDNIESKDTKTLAKKK